MMNLNFQYAGFAPIGFMLLGSIAYLLRRSFGEKVKNLDFILLAIFALLSASSAWAMWPIAKSGIYFGLSFDRQTFLSIIVIALHALAYSAVVWSGDKDEPAKWFFPPMAFLFFSILSTIVCAGDLVLLVVLSVVVFPLTAFFLVTKKKETQISKKYYVSTAVGVAFMAMGVSFIFGSVGSSEYAVIVESAANLSDKMSRSYFAFGAAGIIVGIASFAAIFPFNGWMSGSMSVSPARGVQILLSAQIFTYLIAANRFLSSSVKSFSFAEPNGVTLLAGLSAIWSALSAIAEQGAFRLVGCLLIINTSIALLAASSKLAVVSSASVIYIAVEGAIAALGAAVSLSMISARSDGDLDLTSLAGLWRRRPIPCASLIISLISLAGIFPAGGFWARLMAVKSFSESSGYIFMAVLLSAWLLAIIASMKFIATILFRSAPQSHSAGTSSHEHPFLVAIVVFISLLILWSGIFPQGLISFINASA